MMKKLHIVCKVRKKRYRYISQISNKITPNLLQRDFKKENPNLAWVTDGSDIYSANFFQDSFICFLKIYFFPVIFNNYFFNNLIWTILNGFLIILQKIHDYQYLSCIW